MTWSVRCSSSVAALYLCKSTFQTCVEYCYYAWIGSPKCCLDMFDKLPNQICKIFGPTFAPSLEPLANPQNVTSMSFFHLYCVGRSVSELAKLISLLFYCERSTHCPNKLQDFFVTIRIPRTAKRWTFFLRNVLLWRMV